MATVLSGTPLKSEPGAHQPITWCPFKAFKISRLLSPMKTGAPAAILCRLAETGTARIKNAHSKTRIRYRFMKSNFKTLMIKIMSFICIRNRTLRALAAIR